MNDRELLEFAAIAARSVSCDGIEIGKWNPLEDDGDALRLAVQLNLDIMTCGNGPVQLEIQVGGPVRTIFQNIAYPYNCPFAATRRAIVRAAAEIGRAK